MANDDLRAGQLSTRDAQDGSRSGTPGRAATSAGDAPPPATLWLDQCALFLDLDGTLLDIAARPEDVVGDASLLDLLRTLRVRCQGALALISGRSIADLDRITAPERFAAAGLHGFERRTAPGAFVHRAAPAAQAIAEVRHALTQLVTRHPPLLLEDKEYAVAVHFRQAPHLRATVENAIGSLPQVHGGELRVQHGRMVAEVLPCDASKASALAEFMTEPPFTGRLPVYVGDDVTDESAFRWANSVGGLSVAVDQRPSSSARAHLGSVAAVRAWLHALTESGAGRP